MNYIFQTNTLLSVFLLISIRFTGGNHDIIIRQVPGLPGTSIPIPLEALVSQSFENWRKVMPKGDSQNGLPVIDPFIVPFDIPLTFKNPWDPFGEYHLILSKLKFTGLSTFRVRNLQIDPISRAVSFDNFIGNMSASTDYNLKYSLKNLFQIPIGEGSAIGTLTGTDIQGSGVIIPTPGNWFRFAQLSMNFSFEDLDLRIYPKTQLPNPELQKQIQDQIYDSIQKMRPNMSEISRVTYSKTVELKLS